MAVVLLQGHGTCTHVVMCHGGVWCSTHKLLYIHPESALAASGTPVDAVSMWAAVYFVAKRCHELLGDTRPDGLVILRQQRDYTELCRNSVEGAQHKRDGQESKR